MRTVQVQVRCEINDLMEKATGTVIGWRLRSRSGRSLSIAEAEMTGETEKDLWRADGGMESVGFID